jgi:hypothetical protein
MRPKVPTNVKCCATQTSARRHLIDVKHRVAALVVYSTLPPRNVGRITLVLEEVTSPGQAPRLRLQQRPRNRSRRFHVAPARNLGGCRLLLPPM